MSEQSTANIIVLSFDSIEARKITTLYKSIKNTSKSNRLSKMPLGFEGEDKSSYDFYKRAFYYYFEDFIKTVHEQTIFIFYLHQVSPISEIIKWYSDCLQTCKIKEKGFCDITLEIAYNEPVFWSTLIKYYAQSTSSLIYTNKKIVIPQEIKLFIKLNCDKISFRVKDYDCNLHTVEKVEKLIKNIRPELNEDNLEDEEMRYENALEHISNDSDQISYEKEKLDYSVIELTSSIIQIQMEDNPIQENKLSLDKSISNDNSWSLIKEDEGLNFSQKPLEGSDSDILSDFEFIEGNLSLSDMPSFEKMDELDSTGLSGPLSTE